MINNSEPKTDILGTQVSILVLYQLNSVRVMREGIGIKFGNEKALQGMKLQEKETLKD